MKTKKFYLLLVLLTLGLCLMSCSGPEMETAKEDKLKKLEELDKRMENLEEKDKERKDKEEGVEITKPEISPNSKVKTITEKYSNPNDIPSKIDFDDGEFEGTLYKKEKKPVNLSYEVTFEGEVKEKKK